jgi:PTS system nitrogen regulatory IIA component
MALTIEDVAVRLNVPVETVHRWIRQGKIPMQNNRGRYTIRKEMFARWAEEHQLKVQPQPSTPVSGATAENGDAPDKCDPDRVLPAMKAGGIFYDIEGDAKEELLASAVGLIPNLEDGHRSLILEKLIEREQMASTGIGYGIALPHPRAIPDITLVRPQITTCFAARPVPFGAVDHQPVRVIMVLLSNTTKEHLSLLSKVAFILRDPGFRDQLMSVPPKETIFELVARMEPSGQPNGYSP